MGREISVFAHKVDEFPSRSVVFKTGFAFDHVVIISGNWPQSFGVPWQKLFKSAELGGLGGSPSAVLAVPSAINSIH